MAHLIIEKGADRGRTVALPEQGEILVGRGVDVDLRLRDKTMSRQHFAVQCHGNDCYVRDLNSGNGTFLNGVAVDRRELSSGDQVAAGETFFSYLSDSARAFHEELIDRTVAGHEIQERIGGGGMGTVFRARQISLDRTVAFKVLAADLVRDSSFVERFLREARSAAKLNHPNVTQVYDVGCEDQIYFISMEIVRGGSVQDLLARERVLDPDRASEIIRDAARALEFAEKKQLIHRDVKPSNLMMTRNGTAKLIDLGIAKQLKNRYEETDRTIVGTPDYMAPEQATDEELDTRADIYALGATFYHMVTGHRTHEGDTLKQIIKKKVNRRPRPPAEMNEDVPDWMSQLILEMTSPEAEDRPDSAGHVIERIDRNRRNRRIADASTGHARSSFRTLLHHPIKFAAGTAAMVLLSLGVLFILTPDDADRTDSGARTAARTAQETDRTTTRPADPSADASSSSSSDPQERARKKPLFNRARDAYEEARRGTSIESVKDAIQDHRLFLNTFPDAEMAETVKTRLRHLERKRRQLLLNHRLDRLKEEIKQLQRTVRDRKLTSLSDLQALRSDLNQGMRTINSRFRNLKENYPPRFHEQMQQFREQELLTWRTDLRSSLYTFKQGLQEVRQKLSDRNFSAARNQIDQLRDKSVLSEDPFRSGLDRLADQINRRARSFVEARRRTIKQVLKEERFERAEKLYEETLARVSSSELTSSMRDLKKTIEKQKEARRRNETEQERRLLSRKSARFFVEANQRRPDITASYFEDLPDMERKEHREYLSFLRFLARQYSRFYTTLEQADAFSSRTISHRDFGDVTLKKATTKRAKLSPSRGVSFRKAWTSFKLEALLGFVNRNKEVLTSDQMMSLCAMYFLYGHRNPVFYSNAMRTFNDAIRVKQVEQYFLNVMCRMFFHCGGYAQLDRVEPLPDVASYRSYLARDERSFQNFIADALRKQVERLRENGQSNQAQPYLSLLRSRYAETEAFQKHRSGLISRQAPDADPNPSNNPETSEDTSRADTRAAAPLVEEISPLLKEFQKTNKPRIKQVLKILKRRGDRERRVRILFYSGRYEEAFRASVEPFSTHWTKRLRENRSPAPDLSFPHRFYVRAYRSAVLSDQPVDVRDALLQYVTSLRKEEEQEDGSVREWPARLRSHGERFRELRKRFNGSSNRTPLVQKIVDVYGDSGIPNLKRKFLYNRYLIKHHPDAGRVRNGDALLTSADLLFSLGDYLGALNTYRRFLNDHPDHPEAKRIRNERIDICRKRVDTFNLSK